MDNCNPELIYNALGIRQTGPRTVIVPADPIIWDEHVSYEYLTLVSSEDFGQAYISKRDVPSGTPLSNAEYWIPAAQFNAQLAKLQQDMAQFTVDLTELDSKVDEFKQQADEALAAYKASVDKVYVNACNPPAGATACKGDGVTDDTAALQSCIDLVSNWEGTAGKKGGVLILPPGIYKISSQLNIVNHAVEIHGCGRQSTTISASVPSGSVFSIDGTGLETKLADSVMIGNLSIVNAGGADVIGVSAEGFVNLTLDKIVATEFKTGFKFIGADSPQSGSSLFNELTCVSTKDSAIGFEQVGSVVSVRYSNCSCSFRGSASTTANGFKASGRVRDILIDNLDVSQGRIGCMFVGTGFNYFTDVHVVDSKFDVLSLYGVYGVDLGGTGGINIHDCWFNMKTNTPSTIGIYMNKAIGACITDNVFTAVNESSLTSLTYTGINLHQAQSSTIESNVILGSLVGISMTQCNYSAVCANTVRAVEYASTLKGDYGITIVSSDHIIVNSNAIASSVNNSPINIPGTNSKVITTSNITNGSFTNSSTGAVDANNIED